MSTNPLTPTTALADLPDCYVKAWRVDSIRTNGARKGENVPKWMVKLVCECGTVETKKRDQATTSYRKGITPRCTSCNQKARWSA